MTSWSVKTSITFVPMHIEVRVIRVYIYQSSQRFRARTKDVSYQTFDASRPHTGTLFTFVTIVVYNNIVAWGLVYQGYTWCTMQQRMNRIDKKDKLGAHCLGPQRINILNVLLLKYKKTTLISLCICLQKTKHVNVKLDVLKKHQISTHTCIIFFAYHAVISMTWWWTWMTHRFMSRPMCNMWVLVLFPLPSALGKAMTFVSLPIIEPDLRVHPGAGNSTFRSLLSHSLLAILICQVTLHQKDLPFFMMYTSEIWH